MRGKTWCSAISGRYLLVALVVAALFAPAVATAQTTPSAPSGGAIIPGINDVGGNSNKTKFGMDLLIGVQTFPNPDYNPSDPASSPTIGYQSLGLRPDLSFGKFGVGLNLMFNYRFNAGPDQNQFAVRKEDWVPDANTSLPRALPSEDPVRPLGPQRSTALYPSRPG